MKKFNLMQIIPALDSGGVEQGTIDLANYIAQNRNKNIIISNGGGMLQYLNKGYVSHYKLPVHSKNFFTMPFVARKINSIIEENNINILHVRSRAPAWILPYINKKKITTVSTFHNVYGNQNIFKQYYNKGLAKTDNIVAISKYVYQEITKRYKIDPKKITIINRGIDTTFFNYSKNDEDSLVLFLKNYNISSQKKIILYPGRLTEWKGQLEFLDIIEKIKNNSYMFYFVGDDKNINYKKKLVNTIKEKKLTENCIILGHLDKYNLKMMYHCSDLVISMPLKPEGFGRTISESLSMKKLILAYNYGGAKDQLEKLDDIYKITPNDKNEIITKMKFILSSPSDNFDRIKEESRDFVVRSFSKNLMIKNYIKLYEDILS